MDDSSSEPPSLGLGGQRRSSRLQTISTLRRHSTDTSTVSTPTARSSRNTPAIHSSRSTPGEHSPRNTPQNGTSKDHENPTPSKRTNLRRKHDEPKWPETNIMEDAMKPVTDEERRTWPGWVELESEPTLFNHILREYGVKDVKVQEVFGLEDEALNFLPYWDEDDEEAEEMPKCPNYVWFANQTITNACATIALLNIVMNVPVINLGEDLSAFKAETKGLKPPYRGHTLGENEFIRSIHNSFARRVDMLNADLVLSNDYDTWVKVNNTRKKKGPARQARSKTTKRKKNNEDEEPGFHFIAYVPINGNVWRLDGMQRQPVNLGEASKNWIELARENINLRIAQHDSELQFNLMALCRSPLRNVPEQLAENLHSRSAVEKALNATLPDWKVFVENEESAPALPLEPNECFGLSKELLANSYVSDSVQRRLKAAIDDPTMLIDMRIALLSEQIQLQKSYLEEIASIGMEDEQAARRKIDYTPIIYNSVKELAERGVLKEIVKDLIDKGQMRP
ncbi:Ubiquitin carboxyl-terminal hydrolase isozyme L5 [Hyphodiscus hymeniophilus]|uniref:ubiquitinyl hydrolase 1 n=1 Tax=Hyphodiscus hymeniophilus TaxID=353542 RepID=A0A9P6VFY0_9HELO|nr:Ubiquitin carboxyl-terminal hydrolase isozyme L5 [Hyphodiscus hymeniophilus]